MELRVLGCSGGIGNSLRTTAFLIDEDILIDAGSGVGHLDLSAAVKIKHIFLTHSHLDHVHSIPLLIDSIFDRVQGAIEIHALPVTLQALQEHIFNWVIWPDFSRLPHPDTPVIRFLPLKPGEVVTVGSRRIEMIPVNHVVPAVGYLVRDGQAVLAYSGDTTTNDTLWEFLNRLDRLDMLIVEAAFPNSQEELCRRSYHYCPSMLAQDLKKLRHNPPIYLSHAKPGNEAQILREYLELVKDRPTWQLRGEEVFQL